MATPPDFVAGQVLTAAQMNQIGLWRVAGASFTTATSFSLPNNTFTADFSNYKILIVITAVTADVAITGRLRTAGSDNATTNYSSIISDIKNNGQTANPSAAGLTAWNIGEIDLGNPYFAASYDLMAPQLTTTRTNMIGTATFTDQLPTAVFARVGNHLFNATTQFDSMTIISNVASSITGFYLVYGYNNS